mgnify:CR=1 FL=1
MKKQTSPRKVPAWKMRGTSMKPRRAKKTKKPQVPEKEVEVHQIQRTRTMKIMKKQTSPRRVPVWKMTAVKS